MPAYLPVPALKQYPANHMYHNYHYSQGLLWGWATCNRRQLITASIFAANQMADLWRLGPHHNCCKLNISLASEWRNLVKTIWWFFSSSSSDGFQTYFLRHFNEYYYINHSLYVNFIDHDDIVNRSQTVLCVSLGNWLFRSIYINMFIGKAVCVCIQQSNHLCSVICYSLVLDNPCLYIKM